MDDHWQNDFNTGTMSSDYNMTQMNNEETSTNLKGERSKPRKPITVSLDLRACGDFFSKEPVEGISSFNSLQQQSANEATTTSNIPNNSLSSSLSESDNSGNISQMQRNAHLEKNNVLIDSKSFNADHERQSTSRFENSFFESQNCSMIEGLSFISDLNDYNITSLLADNEIFCDKLMKDDSLLSDPKRLNQGEPSLLSSLNDATSITTTSFTPESTTGAASNIYSTSSCLHQAGSIVNSSNSRDHDQYFINQGSSFINENQKGSMYHQLPDGMNGYNSSSSIAWRRYPNEIITGNDINKNFPSSECDILATNSTVTRPLNDITSADLCVGLSSFPPANLFNSFQPVEEIGASRFQHFRHFSVNQTQSYNYYDRWYPNTETAYDNSYYNRTFRPKYSEKNGWIPTYNSYSNIPYAPQTLVANFSNSVSAESFRPEHYSVKKNLSTDNLINISKSSSCFDRPTPRGEATVFRQEPTFSSSTTQIDYEVNDPVSMNRNISLDDSKAIQHYSNVTNNQNSNYMSNACNEADTFRFYHKRKFTTDGNDESEQAGTEKKTKTIRPRTSFTREQIAELERLFLLEPYPSKSPQMQLSKKLKIPEKQITYWFQNRRMKEKRIRNKKVGTAKDPSLEK